MRDGSLLFAARYLVQDRRERKELAVRHRDVAAGPCVKQRFWNTEAHGELVTFHCLGRAL